MNPLRRVVAACVLCVSVFATGCATSRGSVTLQVPDAPAATPTGKLAVIERVDDKRVFETDPRSPSTPSLKKGDAYSLDATQRKQAIARKRNTYGMALGDILLEGDQTVETLTVDLLTEGLEARGYRVVDGAEAGADALRLQVDIDKFWAWFTPGFWTVAMEGQIHTAIHARDAGGEKRVDVQGYGINRGGNARESNWLIAYERTFEDYAKKLQTALDIAGF